MKQLLQPNGAILETAATTKKRNIFLQILIGILVFFIGQFISSFFLTIIVMVYLFRDPKFLAGAESGSLDSVYASLTQELSELMNLFSLFTTLIPIIVVLVYCRWIEKRRFVTLGFVRKGAITEYLIGLGVGFLLFASAYGMMLLSGEVTLVGFNPQASMGMLALFFLGFLIQGASEEILVRSYFFVSTSVSTNVTLGILLSSGLFAALHLGNPGMSIPAFVNLFLFGVFAALYFLRRGSIWGICAIHTIWNFAQGNIFGCKVSGMNMGSSLLLTTEQGGTLWSGGAFGPEGGIGVTIALTAGILILAFMKNKPVEGFILKKEEESTQA